MSSGAASRRIVAACTLAAALLATAAIAGPPRAAVATAHPLASEAARGILEAGGNAFDAAVAASAALALAADIDPERATSSTALPSEDAGRHTTHLSIIDTAGNRVAATLSINYPFGAGFVAGDTGVLLNDEMDDFAARPGKPNAYGLVGGEPNAVAPGKRPLSSMSPTFLETADRVAVLGTPGGSRIITMVLLGTLAFERGEGPRSWVSLPRYHHQYLPDHIQHEPGTFDARTREALQAMGHTLKSVGRRYGDMQAILWNRGADRVSAAADPRGQGQALVFRTDARTWTE